MKEKLITFETAKLAKEKGFNIIVNRILYFESRTTRELFANTFRELIETAKELL